MEKPIIPIIACVLLEDLSYARRKGDILYMDVAEYQIKYRDLARQLDVTELQTMCNQGAYEFVVMNNGERKYVIQPTLQLIAKWIFGIPAARLDEFDYELV